MKVPSSYLPEYRHLNRKLIPANIVLLILAIVACIAQIFMPLITVKADIPEGSISEVVKTLAEALDEDEDEPEEDGTAGDAEAQSSAEDGITAYAVDFLDKIDTYFGYMPGFSISVSFSPLSLVTSPKDEHRRLCGMVCRPFPLRRGHG